MGSFSMLGFPLRVLVRYLRKLPVDHVIELHPGRVLSGGNAASLPTQPPAVLPGRSAMAVQSFPFEQGYHEAPLVPSRDPRFFLMTFREILTFYGL